MAYESRYLSKTGIQDLSNLLRITRGGLMLPLLRDYPSKEINPNSSLSSILRRAYQHLYQYRHQLLLDLISNLFFSGRGMWQQRHLVVEQWETVTARKQCYSLPDVSGYSDAAELPSMQLLKHAYEMLTPSPHQHVEDATFTLICDILPRLRFREPAQIPQIEMADFCAEKHINVPIFVSINRAGWPIFNDGDIENCFHGDRYVQSLLRFSMLLSNQYFWCGNFLNARRIGQIRSHDWVVVSTEPGNLQQTKPDRYCKSDKVVELQSYARRYSKKRFSSM